MPPRLESSRSCPAARFIEFTLIARGHTVLWSETELCGTWALLGHAAAFVFVLSQCGTMGPGDGDFKTLSADRVL